MSDDTAARRRALGIPVHGDDDHEYRADGYCNCGAERKTTPRPVASAGERKAGKSNLDVIEQNWSEYR